jgi:hypothetical protein
MPGEKGPSCRRPSGNNNPTAITDGVLAQLVERLNGIEAFLSRKSLETNVTCLLCQIIVTTRDRELV